MTLTLSVILAEQGIGGVNGILAAARPYFDLGRIRTGRTLQFQLLEPEGMPLSFRYPIDEDRSLVVWLGSDEPAAGVEQISYDRVQTGRIIEVETTLWEAALEAGLRPSDIVRLSRIFQWEVDFNTEIREGARFLLLADDLQRSGETVRLDTYYAVRLENAGESHTAIRHLTPEGTEEWYEQMARSGPPKDEPWYHVLVDDSDLRTYVAERNLELDHTGAPVNHPEIASYFSDLTAEGYVVRFKSN